MTYQPGQATRFASLGCHVAEASAGDLSKWKQRIVWALIAVWVLSKGLRLRLLHEHGFLSWELWRFDLALAGALVLIGFVAFRVATSYEGSRPNTTGQQARAGAPTRGGGSG